MRGHPVATMEARTTLERVRAMFSKDAEQDYAPLTDSVTLGGNGFRRDPEDDDGEGEQPGTDDGEPFSWFEYCIFLLLGIAMLWAWYVTAASTKLPLLTFIKEYVPSSSSLLPNSIPR